jgi:regulator of protease activity HflC (stomatin/prohibitin superfamily)
VRAYIREEVEQFDGLDLIKHQGEIGTKVLARLKAYVKENRLPIDVTSVNVGTISPPADVLKAIADTQALSNKPAQLQQEIQNHQALAKAVVQKALGTQKSMQELSGQLTPEYLLLEMATVLDDMKDAPNHQIIFMPRVPMTGTVPMSSTPPSAH